MLFTYYMCAVYIYNVYMDMHTCMYILNIFLYIYNKYIFI